MLITTLLTASLLVMPLDIAQLSEDVRPAACDTFEVITHRCDGGGEEDLEIGGDGDSEVPVVDPAPDPEPGQPPAPGPGGPGVSDPGGGGDGTGPGDDDGGWNCIDPGGDQVGPECIGDPPLADPDPEPEQIPDIHWEDVATFAPDATPPIIEPFGAAIARAPMNVAISASTHTVGGELFGLPMSVTFTPELATIDYGDGSAVETATAAPTWDELGQEQLTPTATSHTYLERGIAHVTVDVAYSATVDFGALGVYPVLGRIVSQGDPVEVHVYEKQSYLVDATCEEDPASPGC